MGLFGKLSEMRMKDPVEGTVQVVGINRPDPTATSQNYRMECVVSGPGIEATALTHSGLTMPTRKWPSPGDTLPITVDRSDPSHFVIKWDQVASGREQAASQAEALAAQMRAGGAPAGSDAGSVTPPSVSAADVLARGTAGNATMLGSFPAPVESSDTDHTMIGLMLNVMVDGHPPFQVQNIYKAPNDKVAKLTPGALLPVKADLNEQGMVAVDWDAL